MSPITTLLPAACAPVAASDANSSHGMVRVPIVFFILSASLVFCGGGKLESRGVGSNWPFVAVFCGIGTCLKPGNIDDCLMWPGALQPLQGRASSDCRPGNV